jgi:hypothetical protein
MTEGEATNQAAARFERRPFPFPTSVTFDRHVYDL